MSISKKNYKFLCDEMLNKLSHWLRAAGYDTAMADESSCDRSLLEKAIKEKRLFITRDSKMSEFRHATGTVIVLHSNDMHECAKELQGILSIDWFRKPFSRCMLCNTPLIIADPVCIENIPPQSRSSVKQVQYCPQCDKLYWDGSHVRRLKKMFSDWMHGQRNNEF